MPRWRGREEWLTKQLTDYRIVRFEWGDKSNALTLGLLPDVESRWGPTGPPPLDLQVDRFASLDGLLLLLLLYRDAQDAAHTHLADRLRNALLGAASRVGDLYLSCREAMDTWQLLIESRMVAWSPRVQPNADDLGRAESELRSEQDEAIKPRGTRGPVAPEKLKLNTRCERRWRRRVWVRACCLHLIQREPAEADFDYQTASPLFEWLIANRSLIKAHQAHAIDLLLDCNDGPSPALEPLIMPKDIYERRHRPVVSEEQWEIFGHRSIYDVIPIVER